MDDSILCMQMLSLLNGQSGVLEGETSSWATEYPHHNSGHRINASCPSPRISLVRHFHFLMFNSVSTLSSKDL